MVAMHGKLLVMAATLLFQLATIMQLLLHNGTDDKQVPWHSNQEDVGDNDRNGITISFQLYTQRMDYQGGQLFSDRFVADIMEAAEIKNTP